METELEWIQEDEEPLIEEMRAILGPLDCPEDLSDDLSFCRFLRGHGKNPKEAAEYMQKAIDYRLELISRSPIKEVRDQLASAMEVDLNILPRARELLPCFPVRVIHGRSMNALPIIASVVRLTDFKTLEAYGDEARDDFLLAQLEQRWMVLHNLSQKQRRMVKYFEVRDMNGAAITTLLSEGANQLSKIKNILSVVQDFYPEMIHQVAVLNSTSSFSGLFNFVSPLLNERMQAKIKVRATGIPFEDIAGLMEARAIHSLVDVSCGHLSWSHLLLPSGGNEFLSRWLQKGQKVEWTAILEDGPDVLLHSAFLPEDESTQEELAFIAEEKLFLRKAITSEYEAPAEGVYWLCADNSSSWVNSKTITLDLRC